MGVQPVDKDHGPGCERRHRAEKVAEHVNSRAADIQILAVGALQKRERGHIDEQSEHGDHHHDAAGHLGRHHQPLDRLIDDPGRDGEEREPVGKSDQHLEPVEAVSALPVGRAPREPKSEPGERQRSKVGQHVARVGNQSERACDNTASDLRKHKAAGERRGEPHAPFVVGVRAAMRVGGVIVTVRMRAVHLASR